MTNPIINITAVVARGNIIDVQGTIDMGGNTSTSVFYLDPQPTGTALGPFALTADSTNIIKNLKLGGGKWKIRIEVTPSGGTVTSLSTSEIVINSCQAAAIAPLAGGIKPTPSAKRQVAQFDQNTRKTYQAALKAASSGGKRMAGATALIAAFGTRQRLHIFLNGTLIVRCEYTGSLTASDDANGVKLHTSTATPTTILATGDLTTGQATFVFQGGNGYSLQISGEVGPVASGKAIILSDNPIAGYSFSSDFDFLLPVESESL